MKNFVDRDFKVHLTIARVAMQYLLHLADSDKLPLDVQRYDDRIKKDTNDFTIKMHEAKKTIDTGFIIVFGTSLGLPIIQFLCLCKVVLFRNLSNIYDEVLLA